MPLVPTAVHLGFYYRGNSWAYRLDPRGKLAGLFLYALAALLSTHPAALLAVVLTGVGVWLAARLPGRALGAGLRPLALLAGVVFVFHLTFTPGPTLLRLGPFSLSAAGFWPGLAIATRLLAVGGAAMFVVTTTQPLALMEAAAGLLQPLRILRLPVGDLSLLLGLSLRFIPLLADEFEIISRAQRARGLDWEKGAPWQRLARRSAVFFPLLVALFRRAEEVATAMEVRGYRRGAARTSLYSWHWREGDWLVLAVCAGLVGLSLMTRWRPALFGF